MPEVRLIDANALEKEICGLCKIYEKCLGSPYKCGPIETVHKQPTIEPEVRHGRWILSSDEQYEYCTCSECGYQNGENWMIGSDIAYCANCGAKMDGKELTGDAGKTD